MKKKNMKHVSRILFVGVLVLSYALSALAVTPLTIESDLLTDDEKWMLSVFIGSCMVNGIQTADDPVTPAVTEREDGSVTVRFTPVDDVSFDFDLIPDQRTSYTLILNAGDEQMFDGAAILLTLFTEAYATVTGADSAFDIVAYLFSHLNYDAEYDSDNADYMTDTESYTLVCVYPHTLLTISP
jgi:hypothetical protein